MPLCGPFNLTNKSDLILSALKCVVLHSSVHFSFLSLSLCVNSDMNV